MTGLRLERRGVFAIHDTGAPSGRDDYPTLVFTHGLIWHSGTISRILPFALKYGVRIILFNRRDYPEALPFTKAELEHLNPRTSNDGDAPLRQYLRDRAQEMYNLLETLIVRDNIPQKGGVILAGWSMGAHFTSSFLAHAPSLPIGKVNVAPYIRSVVNFDLPATYLGYPIIPGGWNPMLDPTLPPGEGMKLFPRWITGYFMHGETIDEIEPREFSASIPPTLDTMNSDDIQGCLYSPPGVPNGSDAMLNDALIATSGILTDIRRRTILLPVRDNTCGTEGIADDEWARVKLRHIWCDRSTWSEFWGAVCLEREYAEAKSSGMNVREIEIVRLRGANHFASWDMPERTLQALLGLDPNQQI